jgi:methylaspartate mutase epsilon subunit
VRERDVSAVAVVDPETRGRPRLRHALALGGIGADSHSVGLAILRQALQAVGYDVLFIGIHNPLERFFDVAHAVDAALVSTLDGHAEIYLRDFEALRRRRADVCDIWYLGGNLDVGESSLAVEQFRRMGFRRVFPTFVDVRTVLETLERDLAAVPPRSTGQRHTFVPRVVDRVSAAELGDERLDPELLHEQRGAVAAQWPTGRAAAVLEENAAFLRARPSFAGVQQRARRVPLLQPRTGVPVAASQAELFGAFATAGLEVASFQIDSLTRNGFYEHVAERLRAAHAAREPTLNGFPLVNHGVEAARRIVASVPRLAIQTRHSARDPRLLAEISYASGVTAFEGGAICYNLPYYADYPVSESLLTWRYVDRLTGLYFERFGITLDREFFGTLTGTLIPPSLAIAITVLEAALAALQGVRSVSLGYAEQGNRAQDIAAVLVLRELATSLLRRLGHRDVAVSVAFYQYMAAFPEARAAARELIRESATTAALAGADRVLLKTPVEAVRIPRLEDNLEAIQLARVGFDAAARARPHREAVEEEAEVIRREALALVDGVLGAGDGEISRGLVRAFQRGLLDIPFSPSLFNRGEVMTIRDASGAVRWLSSGSLPFPREIVELNEAKIGDRLHREGVSRRNTHSLVERDVLRIPRREYESWPIVDW